MNISERLENKFWEYVNSIESGLGRKMNNSEIEICRESFGNKVSVSGMVYYFSYEK